MPSPLASPSDDPRVLGWFQWTLSQGVVAGPEVFPGDDVPWRAALVEGFGLALRAILERASRDPGVATAPAVKVPVQIVMANEEAGQLLEEVQVAAGSNRATNYLENFQKRQAAGPPSTPTPTPADDAAPTGSSVPGRRPAPRAPVPPTAPGVGNNEADDVVEVPVTPFGYLLRDAARPGGVRRGRVAHRVDPGRRRGRAAQRAAGPLAAAGVRPRCGPVVPRDVHRRRGRRRRRARHGALGTAPRPRRSRDISISAPRPASRAASRSGRSSTGWRRARPHGGRAATTWPGLFVLAEPADAALDAERDASLVRYALLVAGLLAVTGIGLFVVARTVRREMEVAERKQDFVAAVTHELKTPLASIRMYADMLKEGGCPRARRPRTTPTASSARRSGSRASSTRCSNWPRSTAGPPP